MNPSIFNASIRLSPPYSPQCRPSLPLLCGDILGVTFLFVDLPNVDLLNADLLSIGLSSSSYSTSYSASASSISARVELLICVHLGIANLIDRFDLSVPVMLCSGSSPLADLRGGGLSVTILRRGFKFGGRRTAGVMSSDGGVWKEKDEALSARVDMSSRWWSGLWALDSRQVGWFVVLASWIVRLLLEGGVASQPAYHSVR